MLAKEREGLKRPAETADDAADASLVLFPGALGDAVCFEPTVAALARSARVALYARGGAAEVAALFPAAPEVRSLDAPEIAHLFAPLARPEDAGEDPELAWLDRAGRVVSFTGAGEPAVRARLAARCPNAVVVPFPRPPLALHASDYFLRHATGDPAAVAPPPRLVPPADAAAALGACLRELHGDRLLLVHPGAGAPGKRAPRELLVALAARWRRAGGAVVVALGPAERAERDEWSDVGDVVVPASVAALAGAIAAAAAYAGNDSGPSHVAAALGVPGATLFVAGDPSAFGPRGARMSIVELAGASSAHAIEGAWGALSRALP